MKSTLSFLAASLVAGLLVSGSGAQAQTCPKQPRATPRAFAAAEVSRLAGTFSLTLVSEWPPEPGRWTTGELELWAPDTLYRYYEPQYRWVTDSVRGNTHFTHADTLVVTAWRRTGDRPLIGTTTIEPARVHAPVDGNLASRAPLAPGVRLEGRDLLLTPVALGWMREDGSSTTLHIERVGADGFSGRWTTDFGYMTLMHQGREVPNPSGFFCAVRRARQP
jgi:hypothetical protein